MSPKEVIYEMVDNSKKIEELKQLKNKLLTIDILDSNSSFEFSILFLDIMKIIDDLKINKMCKDDELICSDEEAGIA